MFSIWIFSRFIVSPAGFFTPPDAWIVSPGISFSTVCLKFPVGSYAAKFISSLSSVILNITCPPWIFFGVPMTFPFISIDEYGLISDILSILSRCASVHWFVLNMAVLSILSSVFTISNAFFSTCGFSPLMPKSTGHFVCGVMSILSVS